MSHLTRIAILIFESMTSRMNFFGVDPVSGQRFDGVNLGPVDTNLSKPTQSLIAAALLRDLPGLGYMPDFGLFDGKTLPLEHVGASLMDLVSAGYALFDRSIGYADGKLDIFRLGVGLESINDRLGDFEVMCITANFTFECNRVKEAIHTYKAANSKGKVIVGGRDATFRPQVYLAAGADAVVRGEGEAIAAKLIVELVEGNAPSIPGVVYLSTDPFGELKVPILRAPIADLPLPYFFSWAEVLRRDLSGNQLRYFVESQDGPLLPGVSAPVFHSFTSRGCAYRCSFCTTGGMHYDTMEIAQVDSFFRHLRQNGVRTLISAEDAFLERVVAKGRQQGREEVMAIMELVRKYGFALEWANGVNFNMLYDGKAKQLDTELLDAVFANSVVNGNWIGTYRMLTPVERPSGDARLNKLATGPTQLEIVSEIVRRHQTPSQGLTWILRPEDTPAQIDDAKHHIQEFQREITRASQGQSTSRLGLFCLMPHPGCADAKLERLAAFSIDRDPELRHYFASVLNGRELGGMSYEEQFWTRLRVLQELDPGSFQTWMTQGGYQR